MLKIHGGRLLHRAGKAQLGEQSTAELRQSKKRVIQRADQSLKHDNCPSGDKETEIFLVEMTLRGGAMKPQLHWVGGVSLNDFQTTSLEEKKYPITLCHNNHICAANCNS